MKVSPDGRWIVYVSDETGRDEVHVTSFPEPGRRWQVSAGGGSEPVWAKDGSELFYRRGQSLTAVAVELSPEFAVGQRSVLFGGEYFAYRYHAQHDVSPGSDRFLMVDMSQTRGGGPAFDVVLNWGQELRQLTRGDAIGAR